AASHQLAHVNLFQTDTLNIFYDLVSGGGPLQGQTIYLSIAGEGGGIAGSVAPFGQPKIVSVDGRTGTNWAANSSGFTYVPLNDQLGQYDIVSDRQRTCRWQAHVDHHQQKWRTRGIHLGVACICRRAGSC